MILLWGLSRDPPLAAVGAALSARGETFRVLDQDASATTAIDLSVAEGIKGALRLGDENLDLNAVGAVYARPYDIRRVPSMVDAGAGSSLWRRGLELDDALQTFAEVTPALVVNRASAMVSNSSKPRQLRLIAEQGFDVPATLVTTDSAAALAFCERYGDVIYKSTSGVRSIVSRFRPQHRRRLCDLNNCPTQFQEFIEGTDYRVHVVGDAVFASRIETPADDYRYAGRNGHRVRIFECELDADLSECCHHLAAALDLPVAGIDLRRAQDGRWFCFEVNPSPGFTYYENATGQPISAAVAELLAKG
jgi:glutathione synthase/RimK-type ligase-like ATP-grasp enzyme